MKVRCMNCMKEYEEGQAKCPRCGYVRGTRPREIYHLYPEMELADRYIIGTVVGFGGFGVLYRAWDRKLEHMVAIKEYYPAGMVTRIPGQKEVILYTGKKHDEYKNGLTRFLDEARNTARFSSNPNIVNVFDFFEENGTAYMVMEFLEGVSLKEYISRAGGRLPWQQAVEIGLRIIDALKDVHGAKILHRDLSPDNVFMCDDGKIKLLDFGAARFTGLDDEKTRTIVLKMGFAPPEQYRSKSQQGPYTDIYALGATLYRAITGQTPDESVNRQDSINHNEGDTLKPMSQFVEGIPDYLDNAVLRAMALEPTLRFQNVQQMADALQNKKSYADLAKEIRRRKRRRAVGIVASLVILAAGAAAGLLYSRQQKLIRDLDQVELSVWLPVKDGMDSSQTEQLFLDMSAEFLEHYPGVQLDITCISRENYRDRLEEAAGTEEFPVLFESTGLEDGLGGRMASLEQEVYERLEQDGAAAPVAGVLDRESREVLNPNQVPLGFKASVLYVNTELEKSGAEFEADNSGQDFLEAGSRAWVSDTGEFTQVQAHIAGRYAVRPLENGEVPAGYTDVWSVDSEAGTVERAAAGRLLYFLLRQPAQDILHLRHDTALPVNEQVYRIYLEVNRELEFVDGQLGELEFMSDQGAEKARARIYQEIAQQEQ
ncbi:serine/threonine protein kinase [Enterocloster lavalensis]|uniref:serine/threonine protein kinase n=1 Tax=Enterocloster lavalensis TaxID=460384 RepID=UPI001D097D54|nr:protein kinase [Enterocloster lavalensis]MCB6342054.1 protein kinase [Enterocloster lavalensis]